jgi:hypothetical protein
MGIIIHIYGALFPLAGCCCFWIAHKAQGVKVTEISVQPADFLADVNLLGEKNIIS